MIHLLIINFFAPGSVMLDRLFHKFSLNSINLLGTVLLFLFVLTFTGVVVYQGYSDFKNQTEELRQNYLETQKLKAKDETLRVLNYIHYFYYTMKQEMDEEKLKESIIRSIEQLFDRKNGSSYIFIYTTDGVNVSDPNKPYNRGKNLLNFQDPNGKYVIKDLIEEAKRGGGYVEYMWDNPITKKTSSKVSYAMLFEAWHWMIGTGVYLDELEMIIEENRQKHKERLMVYMIDIAILSAMLFLVSFLVIRFLNGVVRADMYTFREIFKKAVTHNTLIDDSKIRINEFHIFVDYVNTLVKAIHERNDKLQELNLSLEEKVAVKTTKLREQIAYNKQLVCAQDDFIKHSIHEINTPLAVIMTHIDIYKMKYGENKYLSKIEAASKMLSTIYDDLSYIVKKDRQEYVKEWIDVREYLAKRIEFFEEIAEGNEHQFVTELKACRPVFFSEIELQRVIDNNLSNAIKYALTGTDIIVELFENENKMIMRFTTRSKKIEDTEKIFQPFHREDKRESGFGLGLEIVGSICKKENVEIDVTSDQHVTRFTYSFNLGSDEKLQMEHNTSRKGEEQ